MDALAPALIGAGHLLFAGREGVPPEAGAVRKQTITVSNEGGSTASGTLDGMIQANADVVPGDSGSPLLGMSSARPARCAYGHARR